MRLRHFLFIILAGSVLTGTGPSRGMAQELTIVVSRDHDTTELYFASRADVLFDMFGASPRLLADTSGQVDFGDLRQGTFDIADTLLFNTPTMIGQQTAGFEAMSLMVHPLSDTLPMMTPLDAMIAIGVCSGPPAGTLIPLWELQAYVGYFTSMGSLDKAITIRLPQTDDISVTIHDFGPEGLLESYQIKLNGQVPLILEPPSTSHFPVLLGILGVLAGMALTVSKLTQRPKGSSALFRS